MEDGVDFWYMQQETAYKTNDSVSEDGWWTSDSLLGSPGTREEECSGASVAGGMVNGGSVLIGHIGQDGRRRPLWRPLASFLTLFAVYEICVAVIVLSMNHIMLGIFPE